MGLFRVFVWIIFWVGVSSVMYSKQTSILSRMVVIACGIYFVWSAWPTSKKETSAITTSTSNNQNHIFLSELDSKFIYALRPLLDESIQNKSDIKYERLCQIRTSIYGSGGGGETEEEGKNE